MLSTYFLEIGKKLVGKIFSVVFDDDALGLEVLVQSLFAEILPEPRLLEPAERGRHVRLVVRVDEAGAGLDLLGHLEGLESSERWITVLSSFCLFSVPAALGSKHGNAKKMPNEKVLTKIA